MLYSKKQLINIRNNLEKFCKPLTKIDTFKTNKDESPEHNKKISDLMIEHNLDGVCVAVRPILLNGKQPDLMIMSSLKPFIKEVMKFETDERFLEKDYMGIDKIKVRI